MRRLRRGDTHPDPAYDCMYANVEKLVKFICEQEVISIYSGVCKFYSILQTNVKPNRYNDRKLALP